MAYSRIRFEIQNSATMTLVHSRLNEGEGGVLPERKVMTTCFIGVA